MYLILKLIFFIPVFLLSFKGSSSECDPRWFGDNDFTLQDIKTFIQETSINTPEGYLLFIKSGEAPEGFPLRLDIEFQDEWISWDDFFSNKKAKGTKFPQKDTKVKDNKPLKKNTKPKKKRKKHNRRFSVSYKEVKAYAHSLNLDFGSASEFDNYIANNYWPPHFPRAPRKYFKEEWESWPVFLGYKGPLRNGQFSVSYKEVKAYAHSLNLDFDSGNQFKIYIANNYWPPHFPRHPDEHFAEEFESWPVFLGYKGPPRPSVPYRTVKAYAHSLKLGFGLRRQFHKYISEHDWPPHFPRKPDQHFQGEFETWPVFLGYEGPLTNGQFSVFYKTVKAYAHSLNLGFDSGNQFKIYISENDWPPHFPKNPDQHFEEFEGWPVFLGYKEGSPKNAQPSAPYDTVKAYAHSLRFIFGSEDEFKQYISEHFWPEHFPKDPATHFGKEFEGWPVFMGYDGPPKNGQSSVFYETVKAYVHSLNLNFDSGDEFKDYISKNFWPEHFPKNPATYFAEEFEGWSEFLGQST